MFTVVTTSNNWTPQKGATKQCGMSLTLQKGSRGGGRKGAQFTLLLTAEPKSKGRIRICIQEANYLRIHRIRIHNISLKYQKQLPNFEKIAYM